ncbi:MULTISPECIES: hypothetical protein [unclassified Arthrobacter]|uniref:hypothetical protein n=1 Tax=unclassified Arthrobacter TaxID=235627 RepID=UPI002DFA1F01|nr:MULTISPECIES: hypothetical protein [unclassified Arthrobacter]MEC5192426.1 hypothetical protein [Arthrobacter sp. MP_M4]MEC5203910.1 hypothetical protein [Arthrobacter sp. MP_M7]
MTRPPVNGQLPLDPAQAPDGIPAPLPVPGTLTGTASGPVPREPAGRTMTWRNVAVMAGAGVPVGLLWWILAPSGLNLLSGNPELRSGANTEGWLPRDLVLAGLFLLAGCISGAAASGTRNNGPDGRAVLRAVAAAALGAVAAWGTGVVCGLWWGLPGDTSANASIAFSLRSLAVLAIWPAATALAIFLGTIFTTPAYQAPGAELAGAARKMDK